MKSKSKHLRITIFGHFGKANFGNESTLQAILANVHRLVSDAELECVCSAPDVVASDYKLPAIPMHVVLAKYWRASRPGARLFRKLLIGLPSECWRWISGIAALWDTDLFIVAGTGLLTDAFSLSGWGPYTTFRWSVIAKICRCQLYFVSVGAGPLYTYRGRLFVRSSLLLADFRSFRDKSTLQYTQGINCRNGEEKVYPDLAFSLPTTMLTGGRPKSSDRTVVGLGVMAFGSMYGADKPTKVIHDAYLDALVTFADWLLSRGYDVRLLIGDLLDEPTVLTVESMLRQRLGSFDEARVINEAPRSMQGVFAQIAATDFVIGTRFHSILFGCLLNKPVLGISFHHKCSSLMEQMGMPEYCEDIRYVTADRLIRKFCDLEANSITLRRVIAQKVAEYRSVLDEQYRLILTELGYEVSREREVVKKACSYGGQ